MSDDLLQKLQDDFKALEAKFHALEEKLLGCEKSECEAQEPVSEQADEAVAQPADLEGESASENLATIQE